MRSERPRGEGERSVDEGDGDDRDGRVSGQRAADPGQRRAAALRYEPGDRAPHVLASGRGHLAERIIDAAHEAGVPVREDPALARALAALELGAEVPVELYRAVAETLAWAYGLDLAARRQGQRRPQA